MSAIPPCGQGLWLHLLTGPHTGVIPGLSMVGELQLAEQLHWPLKAFRKAFQEVLAEGLAIADWEARVLWLPHGPRHNPPGNPNVVQGWADAIDDIPECPLKCSVIRELKAFLEGFAEAFQKPFAIPFERVCQIGAGAGAGAGAGVNYTVPIPEESGPPMAGILASPNGTARDWRREALTVLAFLNAQTGRHYRPVPPTVALITSRLRSGASVQDCKAVIARKRREWLDDPKMTRYLRPETLFNATKFESYLGELAP